MTNGDLVVYDAGGDTSETGVASILGALTAGRTSGSIGVWLFCVALGVRRILWLEVATLMLRLVWVEPRVPIPFGARADSDIAFRTDCELCRVVGVVVPALALLSRGVERPE